LASLPTDDSVQSQTLDVELVPTDSKDHILPYGGSAKAGRQRYRPLIEAFRVQSEPFGIRGIVGKPKGSQPDLVPVRHEKRLLADPSRQRLEPEPWQSRWAHQRAKDFQLLRVLASTGERCKQAIPVRFGQRRVTRRSPSRFRRITA
jgi:hypothetical protein